MDTLAELVRAFGLDSEDQVQMEGEKIGEDGFLSFRRAARISRIQAEPLHVFVKSSDTTRSDLAHMQEASNEFCRNECVFYGLFAPILDSALARCQLPPVFPRAYAQRFCDSGSILVMEDLQHEGYKLVGRKQLTLPEAQCVVKAMASLQAAYWVARYSFDFTMDDAIFGWESPFYNPLRKSVATKGLSFQPLLAASLECFRTNLASRVKDKEDEKVIREGVERMMDGLVQEADGSLPRDKSKPMGLRHGDLWFSNFVFKGDGESLSCKIFDWQFFCVDLFGMDLAQFMMSSLSTQLFVTEMDNLSALHYATFKEIFETRTGHPVPFSEEAALSTLPESLHFGVFWIVCTTIIAWNTDAYDVDNVLGNLAYVLRHRLTESPFLHLTQTQTSDTD